MTSDDFDLLTGLRLRRINPADPVQIAALLRERDGELKREIADLRRENARLKARLNSPSPIDAITAPIKATNRAQLPTWMTLPEVLALEMVDPQIMPGSTANDLCQRYLRWVRAGRNEEARPDNAIMCRQPGGAGTLITVKVSDFLSAYDRRAMRSSKVSS
ncbi:hypothetical protein QY049_03925 [Bradyrhizobium sp. WYCCWR 13022]|uniref:hypothetical protein n=1 Tax=unclassified Bradyrhizobium TaxID=2631580 RepID=UPI00263B7AFB|nr:hypothetical protein [Bradyrhizobium sp. WYCCWR 13022]MDN4982371.1 hypothetical protein [Bradyrhizobium sp. WYCCWR 13022]